MFEAGCYMRCYCKLFVCCRTCNIKCLLTFRRCQIFYIINTDTHLPCIIETDNIHLHIQKDDIRIVVCRVPYIYIIYGIIAVLYITYITIFSFIPCARMCTMLYMNSILARNLVILLYAMQSQIAVVTGIPARSAFYLDLQRQCARR